MKIWLIISLIIIFIIISIYYIIKFIKIFKKTSSSDWPPVILNCPDYWNDLGDGNCENIHNLGNCSGIKDFSSFKDDIDKCEFVRKCNITWEGIDRKCA